MVLEAWRTLVWSSQSPAHWADCFLAPVSSCPSCLPGWWVLVFHSHFMDRETIVESVSTPCGFFRLRDIQAKCEPMQHESSLAMTAVLPRVQQCELAGAMWQLWHRHQGPGSLPCSDIAGQYRFRLGFVSLLAAGALDCCGPLPP